MLSPRKRRPQNERRDPTASNTVTRGSEKPSDEDIYKWTFTREAVAPCFIQDILQMTANESKGASSTHMPRAFGLTAFQNATSSG
jgi:hypothetical protein